MVPRNVKKIIGTNNNFGAFQDCKNLRSVVFEQGSELTEIGEKAFSECTSLQDICLPDKLRKIGVLAFSSTGLTEVQIPASVHSIGKLAFDKCNNL